DALDLGVEAVTLLAQRAQAAGDVRVGLHRELADALEDGAEPGLGDGLAAVGELGDEADRGERALGELEDLLAGGLGGAADEEAGLTPGGAVLLGGLRQVEA